MKIHTFAVGLLTATIAAQVAPGRVWGVEVPTPDNAAGTYRQAFTTAERTGLSRSAVLQNDVRTTPINDEAKALLETDKEIVDLVRRGRTQSACDWGDVSDMTKVLAELNRVRSVSHLMTLRARVDMQDKQSDAAVDDWLATVAMARRVGEMNLIVTRLVAVAVEAQAIEAATAELPNLPAASRKRFVDEWAKLPKAPTGREMIMGEYAYAKQAIVKQKVSQDWVTILEPFYKEIAAAADGPQDQFEKVVDEQMAKFKLNPFAQTIGPSIKRTRASLAKLDSKRTALEAALHAKA